MSYLNIFYLNPTESDRIMRFEQLMFEAYFGTTETLPLTRIVDEENRRLKSKIPYEDQKIIIAESGGEMIAGMGVNFNMNSTLNLENHGFSIDKNQPGIAEGTGMFCTTPFVDGKLVMSELFRFGNIYMKENGYRKIYGFCGKRMVRSFKALGFELLEEREIMGEEMFLLVVEIA